MTDLVVFENHDVFLEHAIHASIPAAIDTLEQFLQFVSARIASCSGDITASGRYRFVYSLTGKPLWRVADCRSAGNVVVSCTPGFLRRKQSCEAAAAVASSSSSVYLYSQVQQKREEPYSQCKQSPSNSSPFTSKEVVVDRPSRNLTGSAAAAATVSQSHDLDKHNRAPSQRGIPSYERNSPKRVKFVNHHSLHNEESPTVNKDVDVDVNHTTFTVAGKRVKLPNTPRFVSPPFLGAAGEMSHSDRVSTVQTLLSLKLIGGSFVEEKLLFRKELNSSLESVIGKRMTRRIKQEEKLRVVVEGPPRSGVTTTLAYCSYLAASMVEGPYCGSLFLPLNFELLFDAAWVSTDKTMKKLNGNKLETNSTEEQKLMLDIPFFFLTIVRHVIDCAVSQRPSLRKGSGVLIEAWEELVLRESTKRNKNINGILRFSNAALAELVGHQAVYQWEAFAAGASEILYAARNAPHNMELRDILIETVLVRFVAQMASGLHFSNVVFVIDGLRYAARVLQHRVHRPLGDAGVFLRSLTHSQWAHVMIGIDTLALPSYHMLFPAKLRRVRLLHMISPDVLITQYNYPSFIYCKNKSFPLQLLLGAPGYLRVLDALLRVYAPPVREGFSETRYALRVDDSDVFDALQDLTSVLCK
ncbi:uncharacterized protein TM35_000431530 [Trypanosoma theileri]|uniref:Uncharacterized protein n=1 Tax=Trypanosoma theileri TaxID=67003 RepID=A0A1X0NIN1_9TRYP|nr:uncharacterized protein TM35_000431530 [Trypanosoma theileri]ORC84585.1 hypothetical protein TM35_000431530 [Trypanosoma theileri]